MQGGYRATRNNLTHTHDSMPLNPGDTAPSFTLYDDEMKPFSLEEHLENGPVVLLFFPGAFTSVCTTELNTVSTTLPDYGDAQVVGISTDSPFALAEFKKVNDFAFPLLSDHDAEVSAAYGAKYDNDFTGMKLDRVSKRAAFVVKQDGTVAYAEVLENAGNEPDYDAIKSALS
jgi:peroxiredoxin